MCDTQNSNSVISTDEFMKAKMTLRKMYDQDPMLFNGLVLNVASLLFKKYDVPNDINSVNLSKDLLTLLCGEL